MKQLEAERATKDEQLDCPGGGLSEHAGGVDWEAGGVDWEVA